MNAKEAEKQELNLLIGRGFTFDVERTITRGLFRKTKEKELLHFTIQEPTLSTLDRIAEEQIEMQIDEKAITSDSLAESRRLVYLHSKRLARIAALAVLGEDYIILKKVRGKVKETYDNAKLKELTDLFFHCIKPSKLRSLVDIITLTSNLGDFTSSIRSMQIRTTMPDRIEEDEA
jgi:hypothetical protein